MQHIFHIETVKRRFVMIQAGYEISDIFPGCRRFRSIDKLVRKNKGNQCMQLCLNI